MLRSPGNPVTWHLICDLEMSYFMRSSLFMCNLEINFTLIPKSSFYVIDDVIMVKIVSFYIICYEMVISEVKLKLSCAKHGFLKFLKTVDIFYLCRSFQPNPKFECIRKIFSVSRVIKIFVCMLYDKKNKLWQFQYFTYFLTW